MASKTERSVFLYMDPAGAKADEQCGTCYFWVHGDRCVIHRPKDKITRSMSCCYYLYGQAQTGVYPKSLTTPRESGLVDREVRCENCKWFGRESSQCGLFTKLNKLLPDVFKLDTEVDSRGCCNAQEPRSADQARHQRLSAELL